MTIQERVNEHLREGLEYFPESRVVGIFLQGSQNYGLEVENSDVDTKLITVPTFKDIAFNSKAVSTTHVRANNEHIDFKDLRLMMGCFRKQNVNFIEVLFADYKWENPLYQAEWDKLVREREAIAHYSPWSAVKTMKGIALEKYHALEHEYPSKVEILAKYGYDGKQLHHLIRVEEYLQRYIAGEPYEDCLHSKQPEFLKDIKLQKYPLELARRLAQESLANVIKIADDFCEKYPKSFDKQIDELFDDVQYNIMKIAIKEEML